MEQMNQNSGANKSVFDIRSEPVWFYCTKPRRNGVQP